MAANLDHKTTTTMYENESDREEGDVEKAKETKIVEIPKTMWAKMKGTMKNLKMAQKKIEQNFEKMDVQVSTAHKKFYDSKLILVHRWWGKQRHLTVITTVHMTLVVRYMRHQTLKRRYRRQQKTKKTGERSIEKVPRDMSQIEAQAPSSVGREGMSP